jgi:pyruvate kinase
MEDKIQAKYVAVLHKVGEIIAKARSLEKVYAAEIDEVNLIYRRSAQNLLHYLAFRSFEIDDLQEDLRDLGLPSLSNIEGHVLRSLIKLHQIVSLIMARSSMLSAKDTLSVRKSARIMQKNNKLLFGYKSKKRRTRIMVTLPNTAAEDPSLASKLLKNGMNCARINCAHDHVEAWQKMIQNVREASKKQKKNCKIAMDLAGPKLRTGAMKQGPKVIHIRPRKDDLGRVVQPARVWISLPDIPPPAGTEADAIIPVDETLFRLIKRGNTLHFVDSRGKSCTIFIERKQGEGKWGICTDSAYLETGTELTLHKTKQSGKEVSRVGEMLPKEQFISLFSGDVLILKKDDIPGENAVYGEDGKIQSHAFISCTLKEVFSDVKPGEPIFFDDGKIEGVIEDVSEDEIRVRIQHAKDRGSKLKADKGINLPKSQLSVSGLTNKDITDLEFVAQHADSINFSFVNSAEDVNHLYRILEEKNSPAGVILKIETQEAFANLPTILLAAMKRFPVGVMIARGDLAIETGWKNFASIQQEIMRICAACHIPDVWATQVLENLAKKGTPSRSEITDAAMAQSAECVMLNKGVYINKAVRMLDRILRRMQRFQKKNQVMLPRLEGAERLIISHKAFDIE